MKIGILGSGIVAQTLGTALVRGGHAVALGTRDPGALNVKRGYGASLTDWLRAAGGHARVVTFADAAAHGEVVINATAGTGSLEALAAAAAGLDGKILIDVANPLDFAHGMPPTFTVCNTDSLGEQIQRAHPGTRVVKALNTLTAELMVHPAAIADGHHTLPICGNDAEARAAVTAWLGDWFGWRREAFLDLGDLSAARGMEMWLALWVRLYLAQGTQMFNLHIVR